MKKSSIDPNILRKIKILHDLYKQGEIKELENHYVYPKLNKSSRENILYFFLPCALNFQRSSPALWASALATWNDSDTNYLFFPEKVVKRNYEKFRADMIKHKLALQSNKHPRIWHTINTTLQSQYSSDPRILLIEGNYEVERLLEILQKEKKHLFPYLGGIKLSNYVLAVLHWFTDIKLKDVYNLSIIPDTHIVQSSIKLGLAKETIKPAEVEKIWRPITKELDILPADMHSTLWNWSKSGFKPDLDEF